MPQAYCVKCKKKVEIKEEVDHPENKAAGSQRFLPVLRNEGIEDRQHMGFLAGSTLMSVVHGAVICWHQEVQDVAADQRQAAGGRSAA